MSASKERRERKVRNGGVLGRCELTDGRIAHCPRARIAWFISDGRVVRGEETT